MPLSEHKDENEFMHAVIARLWGGLPESVHRFYHRLVGTHGIAGRLLLPNRDQVVTIQSGLGRGLRMRLNIRQARLYYFGVYEPYLQSVLPQVARPGMVAYNLGANQGFYALLLARLVGPEGRVVAFEPHPQMYARLVENLVSNGFESRVCAEQCAGGNTDGLLTFSIATSTNTGTLAGLPQEHEVSTFEVRCWRLDSYVAGGGPLPDLVLMDVEHGEGRVLQGMAGILVDRRPVFIIEMHAPQSAAESWAVLHPLGYQITRLPGGEPVTDPGQIVYGHYLAQIPGGASSYAPAA